MTKEDEREPALAEHSLFKCFPAMIVLRSAGDFEIPKVILKLVLCPVSIEGIGQSVPQQLDIIARYPV